MDQTSKIMFFAVIPAMLLFIAWCAWSTIRSRRKRIRELENAFTGLAKKHGWQYVGPDHEDLPYRFQGEPFGQGTACSAQNVLVGGYRGYQMAAFNYVYWVESSDADSRDQDYWHSVVVLGTPRQRPVLQLQRETSRSKLFGMVGVRDLQLESHEFNKAFLIGSESDRFAYDVLHPRMMEWMLADQRTRELPFRFEGDNLVIWREGSINAKEVDQVIYLLDYACDILDRVPAFVWND